MVKHIHRHPLADLGRLLPNSSLLLIPNDMTKIVVSQVTFIYIVLLTIQIVKVALLY